MRRSGMDPEQRAIHDAQVEENKKAGRARWKHAHLAQWKAANREKINAQQRASAQRKRDAARRLEANRERGRIYREANRERERERGRRLRAQHPDRVREYRRRYVEKHPERFVESNRRASQRWHDAHAEQTRAASRAETPEQREMRSGRYREWYDRNRDAQRERGRDASRIRTRLRQLGLPPRIFHRVYANEKRANKAAADAYFTRPPSLELRARLHTETPDRGRLDRIWTGAILTTRREQPPDPRLVERYRLRSAAFRLRDQMKSEIDTYIAETEHRRGQEIRAQVRLDAIARNARRGPPMDVDIEVARRIRITAIHTFLKHHQTQARVVRQAVEDAITQVRTETWWQTATQPDIAEMWHLAQSLTPEGNSPLAKMLDSGTRAYHGITARLYVAGYTAADLPWLHQRAQTRHAAQLEPAVPSMTPSPGITM